MAFKRKDAPVTSFIPDPKPEKTVKQQPAKIKKFSKRREYENKVYLTIRDVFLKGKICPITGEPATEIHHKRGRIGSLFTDVRYFLAVSRNGHIKIENSPAWAKKMGYSLERTTENDKDDRTTTGHDDAGGGKSSPKK